MRPSPSPGAPSPGAPAPGAPSPGAPSPGAPSPGAPSPGAPAPGAPAPRLSRPSALAAFRRAQKAKGHAPSTLALEQRLLQAALDRLSRRSLARVTRSDLEAYLARRAERVRRTTLSRELGVVAAFFGFLSAQGLIPRNPSEDLWTRPGEARAPILLSPESVGELLVAASIVGGGRRSLEVRRARALRDRALIELLYGLGLRASEAAAVRLGDLDLRGRSLLVRRVKRGKPRRLPLPRATSEATGRYLCEGRGHLVKANRNGEARLFLTERGTRLTGNEVLRIVNAVGRRAGLRVHPHALRRAVASHFVQAGVSLAFVRELLGHVRLDTTQRYVVLGRDDLRRAVGVLDRRLGRGRGVGGAGDGPAPS